MFGNQLTRKVAKRMARNKKITDVDSPSKTVKEVKKDTLPKGGKPVKKEVKNDKTNKQ